MAATKKLYRNTDNAKLFGVCAGIADYFDVDPTAVRLVWLLFIFCFGTGILAYFVAVFIMPTK